LLPLKDAMLPYCQPVFLKCNSNTQAVHRYYRLPKTKTTDFLLHLASEYVDSVKKLPSEHQDWHDFFEYTGAKYFKFDETQSFIEAIRKIARAQILTQDELKEINIFRSTRFYIPLGKSKRMKELRDWIKRMGPIPEPVLITGPTGSGKEVAARMLHETSGLAGAFVPVNCAILSTNPDLAHDRLFGHVSGAYTGAKDAQAGAFVMADGGTLFLDEVAELPLSVQTQLLRVLEEKTVMPLGTMKAHPINVRLIAATNQSFAEQIDSSKFREDLYYRLNVLTLEIPPLVEHLEDLREIAHKILYDLRRNGFPYQLSDDDWAAIETYSWPGNIRQFLHVLKRAAYMKLPVADVLQSEFRNPPGPAAPGVSSRDLRLFLPSTIEDVQPEEVIRKTYICHVFQLFNHNITHTATALGMAKNTLKKWVGDS
ncbi:MAG: sigma 54-interacting transcriptional regulator, partial [bacterium]|nr:sigma 54-interacting transcriptional regulator [bacterium]